MKKYYIGILVLLAITLGLTGFTLIQAVSGKQDKETEKKAQVIAEKLNDYVSANQQIPESLNDVGVKDVPSTIKYTKSSESEYKFCVTYKAAKSYSIGGAESILFGLATRQLAGSSAYDSEISGSSYTPSYLYTGYTHKKGENCQTIKPYIYSSAYDPYGTYTPKSTSSSAKDTERKTDINALHAQLEAYYAEEGRYPTLVNLNDASWRAANMKGLDKESLKDPDGSGYTLAGKAAKDAYSYDVYSTGSAACDNVATMCSGYTLAATLEDGTSHVKFSLNY